MFVLVSVCIGRCWIPKVGKYKYITKSLKSGLFDKSLFEICICNTKLRKYSLITVSHFFVIADVWTVSFKPLTCLLLMKNKPLNRLQLNKFCTVFALNEISFNILFYQKKKIFIWCPSSYVKICHSKYIYSLSGMVGHIISHILIFSEWNGRSYHIIHIN